MPLHYAKSPKMCYNEAYLMTTLHQSICTRCGKTRVVAKQWTESRETRAGVATVSYTTMVCPDPECQKQVDEVLTSEREKRAEATAIKEKKMRIQVRKRAQAIALASAKVAQ